MTLITRALINILAVGVPALAASSVPGISNFSKVDQNVYRGAQPTDEGFAYLAKLGVKVVIDLREEDDRSVAEKEAVTAAGMRYVNVPMTGHTAPTAAEAEKILALLEDPSVGPVFVHCRQGADRTGAVIAAYRIDHHHWDNARALKEAKSNGMHAMQFQRREYIRTFQARSGDATAIATLE